MRNRLASAPPRLTGRDAAEGDGWVRPIGRDSETAVPVFASNAACFRLSLVIKLRAPSSSSLPHRPQFDNWVIQPSNAGLVTLLRFAWAAPVADDGWPCARAAGCAPNEPW